MKKRGRLQVEGKEDQRDWVCLWLHIAFSLPSVAFSIYLGILISITSGSKLIGTAFGVVAFSVFALVGYTLLGRRRQRK